MEVSSISTNPRLGNFSSSESLLFKSVKPPSWNPNLLSFYANSTTSQTLLNRSSYLAQKKNSLKVACCVKKENLVLDVSSMDEVYHTLAMRILPEPAISSSSNSKYIVGLAGPPGAGKSTLAAEVVSRINKLWPQKVCSFDSCVEPSDVAIAFPMDGFHLYRSQLDAMEDPQEAHARRGAPWTFDPMRLLNCLKNLRDKGSVYVPSFDHGVGDPIEDDIYVSLQHKVVIVEGNYLLLEDGIWKEISSMFDEKWFIDVDLDVAMQRVLRRHISTGKAPTIAQNRILNNDRPNAELIMKSKKNADMLERSLQECSFCRV